VTATVTSLAVTVTALGRAVRTVRELRDRRDALICALADDFPAADIARLAHLTESRVKDICAARTPTPTPTSR
jgi:hypothetical protein